MDASCEARRKIGGRCITIKHSRSTMATHYKKLIASLLWKKLSEIEEVQQGQVARVNVNFTDLEDQIEIKEREGIQMKNNFVFLKLHKGKLQHSQSFKWHMIIKLPPDSAVTGQVLQFKLFFFFFNDQQVKFYLFTVWSKLYHFKKNKNQQVQFCSLIAVD